MAQKTIDQIASDSPFTTLDGSENVVINQESVTKGGALNILKDWILSEVSSDTITDASTIGKALLVAVSSTAARSAIGAQASLSAGASSDIVTGSSVTNVIWSPKAIHDAILELAPATDAVLTVNGQNPDGLGDVAIPALEQADVDTGTGTVDSLVSAKVISDSIAAKIPGVATHSVNGLMSSSDKTKLDGVSTNANNYTLPAATDSALGGVEQGAAVADLATDADLPTTVLAVNALFASLRAAGIIAS